MKTTQRIKNLTKVQGLHYDRSYIAFNDKCMDEVMAWVGGQSPLMGWDDTFSYYSFDEEQTQVVRFDAQKRKVDLSEGVNEERTSGIEYILKTERRSF